MLLNKSVYQLASLLTFVVGAQAQEAAAPSNSDVVKLTSENFESFIKEHPLVLTEFFAPWCGHCKNLAPHYVEAASILKDKDITLAQIDCTEEQDLCMGQGIGGYPSLKIFKDHDLDNALEYDGGRTTESIVAYMIKQSLPAVQEVESKEKFEELIKEAEQPVVVFNGDASLNETFSKAANKLFNEFSFVSYPESKSVLAVYLPNEDEPIVFKGEQKSLEDDVDALEAWVKVEGLPYFGEVNGETFASYVESGLPLAYFFYNNDEEKEEYLAFFTKLGKEYRGKLNFAGLDAGKFGKHAENLNMKEQFPLFAVHNMSSNLKYGLSQLADEEFEKLTEPTKLNTKDITKLVDDILAGKAEAIVKSEEIPDTQESAVIKIVGKNHDDIINDSKKDVLVKYYAPWCGHCRRLAPIYEELANVIASDDKASKSVVIGDIDATENDVPGVPLEGYPTVFLYPAGKNAEPVLFDQPRTLESLLAFIQKHGGSKLNTEKILEKYEAEKKAADEEKGDGENEHDEL
ncbi:PDI1 (YCL043C) and EUG1 (YDR518W) [Zygosaccharomyces parabailii]|uniref:protein disulfide-isomerase n=1 Tax=Zygosaccharomyces bailii (strain CLIB 213 / ATCC 58445 / CBS 680 / BCRC 21525 / NBRC 1098 / NCYC 1416 / NRRL Y-2227) TaxID=1333698 RepID=A0A8J2TDX4_ZYGB2|nr:PDI1 (YCL043C) and EUG1 (YDR518W) [Zygosaccharomyces parabailii]CDF91830.1 ZYBA0S14-02146g1_1 [Zygosaccharomyces bailii CLIB 213]CDH09820.1 related to Protein disulfide-isomerase [Zygosaccharomyces bailii ISA1307]SJM88136.1 related to protein disulfide-isomerase [Zygosaccharomyces bailii]